MRLVNSTYRINSSTVDTPEKRARLGNAIASHLCKALKSSTGQVVLKLTHHEVVDGGS